MRYLVIIAALGMAGASTAALAALKPNEEHRTVHHRKHTAAPAQVDKTDQPQDPKWFTPHEWPRSY
jgi:hypothetical protein